VWNQYSGGTQVVRFLIEDPRLLLKPADSRVLDPQIRLIRLAGGIILFSAARMSSSMPDPSGNTWFSIDFRVVRLDAVQTGKALLGQMIECTETTMGTIERLAILCTLLDDETADVDLSHMST
jgi:hypothetical protein